MVGRLLREDNSMMGPIMQEDEYTISVKLRRPVDAPCALPPVISLDANNQSVFVSPSDNATIMHAHATKMVDGIPQPVTIGGATLPRRLPALMAPLSTELTGMNQTQSLSRKHIKEGKGHIVLDMHSIENENAPQRPPPPPMLDCKTLVPVSKGISPTRTENTRTDNGVTHGCLQLPIVQVFAADNSLVAKNNFKAPIKIMEDSDDSKMLVVSSDNKVVESGSLFVPRIAQHCRGDGELYVPPVDEQNLKTLKKEVPVARGNSKRNRNKQNGSLVTKNAANKSIPAIIFESVPPSPSENYLARDPKKIELNTVTSPTKPNVTLNTMSPGSLSVIPTSQQFQSSNVSTKEEIHDSDVKTSIVSKRQTRPRLTLNTMSPGSLLVTAPPTISPDITPKIAPEVPPRFIVKNLTSGFDEINTNKTAPPTLVRSSSRVATARAHLSGMLNQHMERNPSLHKYSSTMPRKPFSPKLFTQRTRSSPLPNLNSQPYSPTSRASFSPAFITQMNSPDTPPVSKRGPNISQPFSPEPPPRSILPWFAPRPNPESPSSEIHSPIYTPMSTPPISAEDSGIMPSFTHIIQDDTHSPTATSCTSSPDWTIDYVSPRGSIYYAYKGDESNSSEEEDSSSATTTPSSPDYPDDLGERVVEVYGGHGHPGHVTTTPVTNGRSAHSTRSQVVDPSQLTSLDFENEGTPHTMLVQDPPSPTHSHDLNHNHNHIRHKPTAGSSSKYLVHESASSGGEDNYAYEESLHSGVGHNPYAQDNYGYDPGYSSERSPEEEEGPPIFRSSSSRSPSSSPHPSERPVSLMLAPGEVLSTSQLQRLCPFIRESTSFEVTVVKNLRGLGLAVTGGVECEVPWAGLIRIKKLYPQTPAWLCGQLKLGDIVLTANSQPLTGLTSHEALEVLRTAGTEVTMQVCRPDTGDMEGGTDMIDSANYDIPVVSTSLTAPTQTHNLLSPSPSLSAYGEFEVTLTKVARSLGFTLRKNDNSILGHTIRSLVKEPAISNGQLRAGDKIISVNNQDMCSLTHEEAIAFLRTCPDTVTLKLYRDAMQTPVSPVSPTEPEVIHKPKPLRKEARDMLEDLAFRKQSPCNSPSLNNTSSPGTPRRRRLQKTPSPDLKSVDRWDSLVRKTCEDTSLPGSPTLDSQLSLKSIQESDYEDSPFTDNCFNDSSHADPALQSRTTSSASSNSYSTSETSRPKRPNFLDLSSGHSCSRKTQFTPPHERDQSFPPSPSPQYPPHHLQSQTPAHGLTSTHSDTQPTFTHHNPGYSSVNFGGLPHSGGRSLSNTNSDHNLSGHHRVEAADVSIGNGLGLLKWKGVVFTPEEECPSSEHHSSDEHSEYTDETDHGTSPQNDIVTINLNRGWNSRLGFSLQPQENGQTIITTIYADSVAAKDGRLQMGDRVVRVNGINCEEMSTEEIIDILRKTRGNIALGVLQQPY